MNYKAKITVLISAILIAINLPQSTYAFGFLKGAQSIGTAIPTSTLYDRIVNLEKIYNETGREYLEKNIQEAQEEVSKKASDAALNRIIIDSDPEVFSFCQMDFSSNLKHVIYQTMCQDGSDHSFSETNVPAEYWFREPSSPRYSQVRVDYGDFLNKLRTDKASAYLLKNGPKGYSLWIALDGLDTASPYWEASIYSWDEEMPYQRFRMPAKTPGGKLSVLR